MKEQKKIAVFGGGRWARVLLGVFLKNTDSSISYDVYTKHLAEDMQLWAVKNSYGSRVSVSNGVANFLNVNYLAAVVVNAASDHKKMAENALAAKVPVLVEKPMAPSFTETTELIEAAKFNNTLLVSSWVFMYASYIDNFIMHTKDLEDIKEVHFNWTDEFEASRYGERKSFDPAVPIFRDVLPHVMSILSKVLESHSFEFNSCKVSRGGSCVDILVSTSNIKCYLQLERNANKRERKVLIKGKKDISLDFSVEPGVICIDNNSLSGDIHWDLSPGPLEKMVSKFLSDVNAAEIDQRFMNELALSISQLVDQVELEYLRLLDQWVAEHLHQKEIKMRDIHYFLSELVLGTMKVPYEESDKVISQFLDIACNGQLLKNFKKKFKDVASDRAGHSIIHFIKSIRIGV